MRSRKMLFVTILLVLALFFERYCFLVSVYKTKFFGYVLIIIVIFLNAIFNLLNLLLRRKRRVSRSHERFNIERKHSVGFCLTILIGYVKIYLMLTINLIGV